MIQKRACLYVPGGLIGQLLCQWEGVIQLSHVGRAPRGMTGVFISAKPSNLLHIAEPLPTLFTNTPRNRRRRASVNAGMMYVLLSAGNQLSGDRFQHVFESGDPRQTEIEDAKKVRHICPLHRDPMPVQLIQRHLPLYQHLLLEQFHSEHEPTSTGGSTGRRLSTEHACFRKSPLL